MSIKDNCVELENGSNLRSFINHTVAEFESLKSASEPLIITGTLSGEIGGDTSNYNDVTITPFSDITNFSTEFVKIEDNAITFTTDVTCAILLTSCEITIGASNCQLYQRLNYQTVESSSWNNYPTSLKRQVFQSTGHQSVHEMWLITPKYPNIKYKMQITSDSEGTARDTSRQNCFMLIVFTNSQKG